MTNTDNCVFCQFDKSHIIDESPLSFAAYYDCAVIHGHIVVALKNHTTLLHEMSAEEASDLMALAARVAAKAVPITKAEKYYIVSIADQVPHYHIHLIPKFKDAPPLGPFIMGESGWKGSAGKTVSEEDIQKFILDYLTTE